MTAFWKEINWFQPKKELNDLKEPRCKLGSKPRIQFDSNESKFGPWTPSKVGLSIEVQTPPHSSSHNLHQCILTAMTREEHSTNLQHIKTIYMANTHTCHHQTWLITAIAHLQEEDNLLLSPFLFLFLGKNIKLYNKGCPSVFKPWLLKQMEKEGNYLFFFFGGGEKGGCLHIYVYFSYITKLNQSTASAGSLKNFRV